MKSRVLQIFRHLSPAPEAIVLANSIEPHLDQSFFYVFDVASGLFEGSIAVAHPDGRLDVLSSPLEAESAQQAAKHDPSVTVHVPENREAGEETIRKLLPATGTVGLNYAELTHESFLHLSKIAPKATWADASGGIQKARRVKDAEEIRRLERAGAIGSQVAERIPSMLRAGVTELELAAEIEYAMCRAGASGRSFATIAAFGSHGAEPHFSPEDRRLEPGQSIVCDFGAFYRRYASDITRSFRFGPADAELKQVHETVEAAQQAALGLVRAGAAARDVHLAAQKVIDASPWKGRFTHGLGHSIGLSVHDGFSLSGRSNDALEAGMTVTVEPGIYLPGRGGVRIEDDVLVTETGYRFLTTAPRGYLEVAA